MAAAANMPGFANAAEDVDVFLCDGSRAAGPGGPRAKTDKDCAEPEIRRPPKSLADGRAEELVRRFASELETETWRQLAVRVNQTGLVILENYSRSGSGRGANPDALAGVKEILRKNLNLLLGKEWGASNWEDVFGRTVAFQPTAPLKAEAGRFSGEASRARQWESGYFMPRVGALRFDKICLHKADGTDPHEPARRAAVHQL